ncbi:MAG: dihydrolipoamide acetyltransferase family protein [Actinomycetota bacterium]|nr:dihydrolipoamide acetyltransferase family protein [Actinomycetota bacterium]
MAVEVTLPELGESVEGGTLVTWLVGVGDPVSVGQAIAEVSTDKVDTEVPSPVAGTVLRLVAELEAEVLVGAVLLELDGSDEPPAMAPAEEASASIPQPVPRPVAAPVPGAALASDGEAPSEEASRMRLSPSVRRLVREHGLDPTQLRATGQGERLTRDDVLAAVGAGAALARPAAVTAAPGERTEALSRMRRVIAQRMTESLHTTAQLTSAVEADLTRIMALRARVRDTARERHGVSVSPLAFLAHATIRALQLHPLLNASIDVEAGTFTLHTGVNLGIAVDAPNGLMVPVIRDAQLLGPVSLQQAIADLAERARTRRITPDDLAGGTFTITNTGSRGSLFDTPILNPPEVGILATPAIEKRPVVITASDGTDRIAIRHRTYLCLTYDHRLIDGADAARFLGELAALVDSDDWGPELDVLLG